MHAIFDQGPPPLCPAPFNLAAYVLGRAGALADSPALVVVALEGAEQWSYARLEAAVLGTAAGFLREGLRPGDRLLMRLGNSVEFPICYLAALAADLIPVPTSAQLTAPELDAIAADIRPAQIVAEDGLALPSQAPCSVLPVSALRDMYGLPPAAYALGDPERPGYIIYTSGTSGQPRAVIHAHRAIWARRMMWEGWYGLTEHDRLLHAGAFNWTYTLGTGLMDPWSRGATALIPEPGTRSSDLATLIAAERVTIFAAAPGIYRQMLRGEMPDAPALRHGLTAGEKLADPIRDAWQDATGTTLHEAFGMSECSTFVSGSPARPAQPGSLGYPQPGRTVAVLGENGPAAFGEPGVLAVKADDPGLMLGYIGAENETRARFRGPWFLTGDTVAMAEDGAITYLGRDDDMMNAGGFRVSPVEVESAMVLHPEVLEAAAVEISVSETARVIACFYVAEPGRAPDDAALAAHAAETLAHYKCPRLFVRVDTLPKGANNKLLRRALRAQAEAGDFGPLGRKG